MVSRLIVMNVAFALLTFSGTTLAQQNEDIVITQEEFEQMERDGESGVIPRSTSSQQSYTGCVNKISINPGSGNTANRFSMKFFVDDKLIGITPNGLLWGAFTPNLSQTQIAPYEFLFTTVRHAVQEKVKVKIYYKGNPAYIYGIYILYDSPCQATTIRRTR